MRRCLTLLILAATLSGCAVMEPILDWPVSLFTDDGEEVETTVGDAIADNSDGLASTIGNAIGGVNPLLGLLAAGGAGALLSGARRKKKDAAAASKKK